jgi:hypothetical protein
MRKTVILDSALFADALRVKAAYDSFCAVLNCSLVKLHENAELYACVRGTGEQGEPCKLYVTNCTAGLSLVEPGETEWIEVIGDTDSFKAFLCRRGETGETERSEIPCGVHRPRIPELLGQTMNRLSTADNRVLVLHHEKTYRADEREAFRKRSVVDPEGMDSRGVDILYFDGADKLIEKLLFGGCRELTVFVTQESRAKSIVKSLERLSRRAPYTNRLTVVIGKTYEPRTATALLVGSLADLSAAGASSCHVSKVHFSVHSAVSGGTEAMVGQNTAELVPDVADRRLKPHAMHYITSVMSELVMRAVSTGESRAKRLFLINGKTLMTETIMKED